MLASCTWTPDPVHGQLVQAKSIQDESMPEAALEFCVDFDHAMMSITPLEGMHSFDRGSQQSDQGFAFIDVFCFRALFAGWHLFCSRAAHRLTCNA